MPNTGLKRDLCEKFYTKIKVANQCIADFKKHIKLDKLDLIIEPSAGNGAFIPGIKKITNQCKFFDIEPQHEDILCIDFLTCDHTLLDKTRIHILGNPPFGRQSSLAKKFIKKSAKFANSISFILPKSFKKQSNIATFPLNFHLIFQTDLPAKSFLIDNKDHDVPCIFQIWIKRDYNRLTPIRQNPNNFQFVKKNDNPDISFRRVGVYAGTISTICNNKSEQSHYFIKFDVEQNKLNILYNYNPKSFTFNNTVGPKSISKPELIKVFNSII